MKKLIKVLPFLFLLLSCAEKEVKKEIKIVIVEKDVGEFSEESFHKELDKFNWKFKDVVYAQARLESGFSSENFKLRNNLFGMKVAKSRLTTAKESKKSAHARYDDWKLSIVDRALFESAFMRKIKTREQYLDYLAENYAGDKNYKKKLLNIIRDENKNQ